MGWSQAPVLCQFATGHQVTRWKVGAGAHLPGYYPGSVVLCDEWGGGSIADPHRKPAPFPVPWSCTSFLITEICTISGELPQSSHLLLLLQASKPSWSWETIENFYQTHKNSDPVSSFLERISWLTRYADLERRMYKSSCTWAVGCEGHGYAFLFFTYLYQVS